MSAGPADREEVSGRASGDEAASGEAAGGLALTFWRITSRPYADGAFSGEGARLYGGCWNSEGMPMIYLADSLALAALEQLVHLSRATLLAGQFVRFRVRIPATQMLELDPDALPEGGRGASGATQALGDTWAAAQDSVALRVPSAIVPEEANVLVNPSHPKTSDVLVIGEPESFAFDERLLR